MLGPPASIARAAPVITRPIPSTEEALPVVGLGSWITFNVGDDIVARDSCAQVMAAFFEAGGRLIDSSPMYGSSQEVIGYGLEKLGRPVNLFAADKVWTSSGEDGPAQMEELRRHWNIPRFDLVQVHNLVGWQDHLETLGAMKAEGKLRYVGITTSEGRRHGEFEKIMASESLDFIQVTYNVLDREAERRIFPMARERGIAVIVNRPFRQGELTENLAGYPLPPWAGEIGAVSWAQLILKFIVSHPAVTCAIPATTKIAHVRENLEAARGNLPDEAHAGTHGRLPRGALMSEWWSYSPSDFLLFSPETYYRLFELHNEAVWPVQIAALVLGFLVFGLLQRPGPWQGRVIATILAACWLWVAWAYLITRYATINWAARYFAAAFVLEAMLLIAVWVAGNKALLTTAPAARRLAMALFVFALVIQPLIGPLMGRPWPQMEIFGITPNPTVVATLAILALSTHWSRWVLAVIPVLWCLLSGVTEWTMVAPDAWIMPLAMLIALVLFVLNNRGRTASRFPV